MQTNIRDQITGLTDNFLVYLPNLVGGIILILLGWFLGWIIKRILVNLFVVIRIDRFLKHFRFKMDLSKADVRYSFYNFIGNIAFALIFMIFMANAFLTWKLNILSDLLSKGILFLPKIIIALVIFGIGWLISRWGQLSVMKSLQREGIPRASLISKFVRSIILIFFSAISFAELDVSREIVIIGFATIFITLGAIAILLTAIGGKYFITKVEDSFKEGKNDTKE